MEEIAAYSALKREFAKPNSKVTKSSNGLLYYEDTELGQDPRSAAERLVKDPELKEIKSSLILED